MASRLQHDNDDDDDDDDDDESRRVATAPCDWLTKLRSLQPHLGATC